MLIRCGVLVLFCLGLGGALGGCAPGPVDPVPCAGERQRAPRSVADLSESSRTQLRRSCLAHDECFMRLSQALGLGEGPEDLVRLQAEYRRLLAQGEDRPGAT